MGGALPGALALAAAGQMDVADATSIAVTAMTQFQLKGSDIPHVADLLAAGADKALGSVGDLGMALKQGGLVAAQFGLSVDDTVGTLSAFANAGLIGSDAGTSFKTMLTQLAAPSTKAQALLDKYNITLNDSKGNFIGITGLAGQLQTKLGGLTQAQRNAALATIFGTDAVRAANVLYKEGASGSRAGSTRSTTPASRRRRPRGR
jgi:TP901 family phage tail tape measure protein